ncbi:NUDIX domain-containing protein [Dyadobacter subterraneus]|uniref:NUDIX hydrolase n=1 Tax=Dyadobacter subterraneus TaxID=2773304 RepID=A0ABR9WCE5_9BACT|nr:NUDIX hydrolase [Dyadobacter subterraneus]MBE9463068.1 NUDIX hydrolase [Dyadobacter subterraneus]
MDAGKNEITELYGSRLRIRVCGICVADNCILMIRHRFLGDENIFWSPPGGGMQFGESAPETLKREFLEETGLEIEAGELLFVNEFIQPPLHAVELFFQIRNFSGSVITGIDPECSEQNQIIKEVRFMSMEEIKQLPENHVHSLFHNCETIEDVLSLKGYL